MSTRACTGKGGGIADATISKAAAALLLAAIGSVQASAAMLMAAIVLLTFSATALL